MKVEIIVYKKSGKFYASDIVENDKHLFIYDDEYKEFIANNLPAKLDDGYIVVTNANPEDRHFYEGHYTMDQLTKHQS